MRGGRRAWTVRFAAGLALALLAVSPAAAWEVSGSASAADFDAFHRLFAETVYPYPRHAAAPLGLVGFELYVEGAGDPGFGGEPFAATAVRGSLPGDLLAVGRVGVRKGLPGGVDVGVSYGRTLGGGPALVSGEVQWAFVHGGLLEPAVALRLTGDRSTGSGPYDLHQYGAELLLSKGFAVLTPYVGAGLVRSEGTLERDAGSRLRSEATRGVVFAGVAIRLALPELVLEVEKGDQVEGAVRFGFRF